MSRIAGLLRLRRWHVNVAASVLAAGLALAAYSSGLGPMFRHRAALVEDKRQLPVQKRRAAQFRAQEFAARKRLEQIRGLLASGRAVQQAPGTVNQQVAAITELVSRCGLEVDDIRLGKLTGDQRFGTFPISLAGKGGYVQCAVFLHRLCQVFPDAAVSSFQLTADPARLAGGGTFRFDLLWHTSVSAEPA